MTHWKAAFRAIIRRPAFTITTVAVLAFGIAGVSALFSIVDTVLLKPLPYPNPDRLVFVMEANSARAERASLLSAAHMADWTRLSRTFEVISAAYRENVTDTSAEPERLVGRGVAPGYFVAFGKPALIGRTFLSDEEKQGGPKAAVISEALWTRRYQRDPKVLEKRLLIGGTAYPIVGVMPRGFVAPETEVWFPAQLNSYLAQTRDVRIFTGGVGRMKPGVTIEQARADLEAVCLRLGEQYPKTDKGWSAQLTDYKEFQTGSSARMLALLFSAVAMLLLILCANISGLLLGQLQRRERELAVRSALGATRGQVIAVVLREVTVLAALSGAAGLVLAYFGTQVLSRVFAHLPRIQELQFDWRVAVFTLVASLLTALAFGWFPALRATRRDAGFVLAQGGRSLAGGRQRAQQILIGAQFAITVVLLVGAGLLLRSYYNLTRVAPGFRTENVITFHVGASWGEDRKQISLLQRQLISELEQLPQVKAAGLTNFLPASNATLRYQASIEGLPQLGDEGKLTAGGRTVSEGYLRAIGVPLLQGTLCPEMPPDWNSPAKVVINQRMAEIAGVPNLVGRHLTLHGTNGPPAEIVGIVGSIKEDGLSSPAVPYTYWCAVGGGWPDPEYVVATEGDPRQLLTSIRQVVRRLAPHRAIFGVSTLAEHMNRTLDQPRLNAGLLGVFAASALVSAALGLYGLLMLTVTARSREIGVRMALGARPGQIVAQVVQEALQPLLIAIVAGVMIAFFVLRAFRQVLFEVSPGDWMTFASVCLLLLVVAAIAASIPSHRAARIDPVDALRSE